MGLGKRLHPSKSNVCRVGRLVLGWVDRELSDILRMEVLELVLVGFELFFGAYYEIICYPGFPSLQAGLGLLAR